ncbi:MAG TPA: heavy metal translocating P-type ATPase [Lachnospiraceae bacterium]
MEQYNVTGMSCAACSARVEKAVLKVDGVTSCTVSLLTNSMGVEGSADESAIKRAVENAGYHAQKKEKGKTKENREEDDLLKDTETPKLKKRLWASLGFLLLLMYVSMGHMMWGWPLPAFFNNNHVAMGLIQLLLTVIIMVINQKFFVSGFKGLLHGAPNMDTLVALGSGAAFLYSSYALFAMTDAQVRLGSQGAKVYMHEFYFESAAMILTLITVGKMLEAKSKGRTTDALKGLMKLAPKTARRLREDGSEEEIEVSQLSIGDYFVVRPGETIPVDALVVEGHSAVDEAALTGESIPVDKAENDRVSAGTLNQSGFLKCRASQVGEDTTLAQIIRMVSDAAATKAPIAKVADKVSGVFVPVVIGIALVTMLVWIFLGQSFGFALARGISVLVISCPCALGLATPVAIMVGNGRAAKCGIMFKTAVSLEETGKMDMVALDKTGTITMGEPQVTDVLPAKGSSKEELLSLALSLEVKSEHPLAKAICAYGNKENVDYAPVHDFVAMVGNGLKGQVHGKLIYGGNDRFISSVISLDEKTRALGDRLAKEGKTPLYFASQNGFLGIIAVADIIKETSKDAISQLRQMGLKVLMLTGDNVNTAKAIGQVAGVDKVVAGLLPQDKEEIIRKLKSVGKVAMVGDGINDAPALTRADMGIAIGAGTDVAIDAADIVLMKSDLKDVVAAIVLSRKTLTNIHENLFWAFIYNIIGIPLAAGVWISLFGWSLNPMFGAAAMSLSSFCVVSNALRLNWVNPYKITRKKKEKEINLDLVLDEKKEDKGMEKVIKIEGMMCGHCEASVKKALESLEGVKEALVSHEKGEAIVSLQKELDDTLLKETVEAKDYKVLEII